MANLIRERVTVDLRGFAPALKAEAQARQLTVPQVVRVALLAAFPPSVVGERRESVSAPNTDMDRPVRRKLQLHCGVAARLSARARECGLPQSVYITTLIEGTPAPPLALVKALCESNDQLAVVAADASEMIRRLRKDVLPSDEEVQLAVRSMIGDTRRHLELASRVVAELRPPSALPGSGLRHRDAGRRGCP